MCLFDVKQCKRVGISIEEGGVSNNTQEAQHPFNVSTPPRRRWFKMQVRQKELESVTNAVPLASNSDDAAPNVATVNIGSAKAIRSWILTLDKQFGMYLICGLRFVNFQL